VPALWILLLQATRATPRQWTDRLWPYLIFLIGFGGALLLRSFAIQLLHRYNTPGRHTFAPVLLRAMRMPSLLWCVALGLAIAVNTAELTRTQSYWANRLIGGFLTISISLVLATVAVRVLQAYGERNSMPFATAGLTRTLTYIVILGIGFLLLLRHFDVSITPLLTALGVGGLAVALALQDTLANFFAGVHILVETPIRLGDFIRLSSGEEGVVTDIGWRTTRVRTFQNTMIVIPNTRITTGVLVNFNLPEPRTTTDIAIIVSLEADAERVAAIIMDSINGLEGMLTDPAPILLFDPGITLTHMQFKLVMHCANPLERGLVQSRARALIHEALQREAIPYPSPAQLAAFRP
jgi:small-conductance mechanosensitive channel